MRYRGLLRYQCNSMFNLPSPAKTSYLIGRIRLSWLPYALVNIQDTKISDLDQLLPWKVAKMTDYDRVLNGSCHCRAVTFTVKLLDGVKTARRCTCSMCLRRGVIPVSAIMDELEIITGSDKLSSYQFGTKTANHYFCSQCGIYTHHQRRSNPEHYGINPACLEGFNLFDLKQVPILDGTKHPRDNADGKIKWIGRLRHERK